MIIVFRALLALLLVAFVVVLGGVGLSYYFVSRSLPDYNESFLTLKTCTNLLK